MSTRPATLAEVAERTRPDRDWFQFHLSEFLDEFYMDTASGVRQERLETRPDFLGDAETDAWLCATGEYLAEHWALRVPAWVNDAAGSRLTTPQFPSPTEYPSLREVLKRVSPSAFRKRNLFVEPEPLRRASAAAAARRTS